MRILTDGRSTSSIRQGSQTAEDEQVNLPGNGKGARPGDADTVLCSHHRSSAQLLIQSTTPEPGIPKVKTWSTGALPFLQVRGTFAAFEIAWLAQVLDCAGSGDRDTFGRH